MQTSNNILIRSTFDPLFDRAADIANWANILPHYRWIRILEKNGDRTVAEMAARHNGFPLWWKTIQTLDRPNRRIYFKHIGGVTKGMDVYWEFTEQDPSTHTWRVEIFHEFKPSWFGLGSFLATHVIGKLFVHPVATKTLSRMKVLAEAP